MKKIVSLLAAVAMTMSVAASLVYAGTPEAGNVDITLSVTEAKAG